MSDPRLDPALRDALDRFTVPPLSQGFADRVVAAATHPANALPVAAPTRRDRRGGWVRGHRVIVGAFAFGLMSAAAAATAIFGDVARTMPLIGPLIASIAPEKPAIRANKVKTVKPPVVREAQTEQAELADPPSLEAPPLVVQERRELRREFVAQKIAFRLEHRAEVRAELGLPPRPVRPARILTVLRRLPPVERAAIVERVREIRQEQRAAPVGVPDGEPLISDRAASLAPKVDLNPDSAGLQSLPTTAEPPPGEVLRTPERLEQLRRLRAIRALQERRRELRRQRVQQ